MFAPAIPLSPNPNPGRLALTPRPRLASSANGSDIILALEDAYAEIKAINPELPRLVVITGTGVTSYGAKWGHFNKERWLDAVSQGRLPEMFIAGETLAAGAEQTLQTMLHECAHALAAVRNINDTSSNNKYHNKKFLKIARELTLDLTDEPSSSLGYSFVMLTERSREVYSTALKALAHASDLQLDTFKLLGITISTGGLEGGCGRRKIDRSPRQGKDKNLLKCECACEPPRVIRMSRKVLGGAAIMCEACYEPFGEAL